MIFAMDPFRRNFLLTDKIPSMQNIAKELFDDELVYNNKQFNDFYSKRKVQHGGFLTIGITFRSIELKWFEA